ncbi:Uncharacterized protein GBIM_07254 [Gryllus bimaculatus]|nr:Uncharacterized protein GBIM_07254 [Gryllus bimaculatus]
MYTNFPEPDYPAALGIISHLSSDELKDILNDETKFEELMKDIKQFKDLETEKEMIIASNRSLAEFNLAKEPQLQEGKQRLQDLSAKGEELCQSVESKIGELKKFLEGDLEIDGFLEQFSARRKLMHLRRVKADKMTELLAERSRSPNVLSRSSTSSSQVLSHFNSPSFYPLPPVAGSAGATPYPVGGINMPMPMPGPYRANVY